MKHKYSRVSKALAVVLTMALCLMSMNITGCSTTPTQAVQNTVKELNNVKNYIAAANTFAVALSQVDPALAAEITEYAGIANTSVDKLIQIGNTYLAKPDANGYQALLNGVDALVANVDQELLKAARIANPQSQGKVLLYLGLVATGLHLINGFLVQKATPAQMKALPVIAHVDFNLIKPYLNRPAALEDLQAILRTGPEGAKSLLQAYGM